jgi:DNA-binding NtrC family response regulator
LQERQFERVGGTRTIKADIRLIAATNRDLEAEIKTGGFRADLYYRLNVVTIMMPALRDRREDIGPLSDHFLRKYAERCNRQVRGFSPSARNALAKYEWPGNVRELENAIERAVVLGADEMIQLEDLPEAILETGIETPDEGGSSPTPHYHEAVKAAKKELIQRAVDQANGNLTEAARLLGVNPNYLHRLINNLDLRSVLKK